MSYTSNFNLNQRVSYLESEIGKIAPIPPGGYNLDNVLTIGNSAGTNDIDLNNNDILQVNNIDVLTINGSVSLTFTQNSTNPSLSIGSGDFVLNADTNRLLLNANDNQFYLGNYSNTNAPVINSGGVGMNLEINSRSGTTNIGDCDNAFNGTKISVVDTTGTITLDSRGGTTQMGDLNNAGSGTKLILDDTTTTITIDSRGGATQIGDVFAVSGLTNLLVDDVTNTISLDSRGGKSQMGDVNNNNNLMKIVVDDGAGVINIDNGGDQPINIGDLGGNGNGTKIIVNDATATFTIDFPTINFSNTTTTTSTSNHNAPIRATSNGLESTTFLKCKLNGNDIWIPYFTTDPSL